MAKKDMKASGNGADNELPEETRRKTERLLKVLLTPDEERYFGKEIARARQELAAVNDELDEVKSQFKSKIESCEKEQNRFMVLLNNGYEYRQVECEVVNDYKAGTVRVTRMDTGELVEERAMNDIDRQRELPMPARSDKTEGDGAAATA